VIYDGKDTHELLTAHSLEFFDDVEALKAGTAEVFLNSYYSDDSGEGLCQKITLRVKFLFLADGAGRRSAHGRASAASTFPMGYNELRKILVSHLTLFAPITLSKARLEEKAPRGKDLTHKQRLKHARNNGGAYGENLTRADLTESPTDVLHQLLLILPRLILFLFKAVQADANTECDTLSDHLKKCCGLHHTIKHVEQDGGLVIVMYGNDGRVLLPQLDKLLTCDHPDHVFLSLPEQRIAICNVFTAFKPLFYDLKCGKLNDQLSPGAYFLQAHIAITLAVATFGPKFVTPTIREFRDQNPYFKQMLAGLGSGYTLRHVEMECFEARNKHQKRKWHADLKAGGSGAKDTPLKKLLVSTPPPKLFTQPCSSYRIVMLLTFDLGCGSLRSSMRRKGSVSKFHCNDKSHSSHAIR